MNASKEFALEAATFCVNCIALCVCVQEVVAKFCDADNFLGFFDLASQLSQLDENLAMAMSARRVRI